MFSCWTGHHPQDLRVGHTSSGDHHSYLNGCSYSLKPLLNGFWRCHNDSEQKNVWNSKARSSVSCLKFQPFEAMIFHDLPHQNSLIACVYIEMSKVACAVCRMMHPATTVHKTTTSNNLCQPFFAFGNNPLLSHWRAPPPWPIASRAGRPVEFSPALLPLCTALVILVDCMLTPRKIRQFSLDLLWLIMLGWSFGFHFGWVWSPRYAQWQAPVRRGEARSSSANCFRLVGSFVSRVE